MTNIHSQGNHYDSIICVRPQLPHGSSVYGMPQRSTSSTPSVPLTTEPTENLERLVDPYHPLPTYATVIEDRFCKKKKNKDTIIDLTGDDSHSDSVSDTTYFSPTEGASGYDNISFTPPAYTSTSSSSETTLSAFTSSNEDLSIKIHLMESEMEALLKNISRGKPFPTWYFRDFPIKRTAELPKDIDGLQLYKIKAERNEWLKLTSDNRHFFIMTTTHTGYIGEVRIGTCMGSYICRNPKCPFVLTSQKPCSEQSQLAYT